jgi:hypothetical protein
MRLVDTDTLAARRAEELLRHSLCAGESNVRHVLYNKIGAHR